VATRERSSWEKFASFSRAPTEYMRRNAEGKIETTTSRFGFGPEQPKAPSSQAPVAPVSREEALAAFGLNAAGQPLSIAETFGYGGQSRIPQQAAQPPKPDHAAAARAMAESIGSRTLNVKVTNASELRGGPTTGGPPRPGYEGR